MLIERRKIEFPENDLLEAISLHDELTSQRLGEADLLGYEIETDGETTEIRIKVCDPGSDVMELVTLPFSYVIAAMIRYCVDEGIPIPRRSVKRLEISGDYVALVLQVANRTITDIPLETDARAA